MARGFVLGFFCCPSAVCRSVGVAGKRPTKLLGDAVIGYASCVLPFEYCRAGRVNHFALPFLLVLAALIKMGYFSVGLLCLIFYELGKHRKLMLEKAKIHRKVGHFYH